ncbi:hypothetical protein ACFQ0X_06760 [Streptomyces rectiviolaceus]|uniref:Uncharacterized protein n=1 Tax=Streptomyces rectiviolaceus TaxID=332591 RepID=A0ABP6NCK1_9ACTN
MGIYPAGEVRRALVHVAADNNVPLMTENLYDGTDRVTDAISRT